MSTRTLMSSAEYAAKAEKHAADAVDDLDKSRGVHRYTINLALAQVYATLAGAAATAEAGSQVSDVGPAIEGLVKEVRDGLDAIARSRA